MPKTKTIIIFPILVFGFLGFTFMLAPDSSFAYLTDKSVHSPPSSGTYQYSPSGNPLTCYFCKGVGAPAPGDSYVDPVFGETITTITNLWPYNSNDPFRTVQYNQRPYISANNTYIAAEDQWTEFWFYKMDGTLYWHPGSGVVQSLETQFDPSDDDVFYFYQDGWLKKATLSTKTVSSIHNFGAAIDNGGSGSFTDNSGRYFVALTGGSILHIYDRIENIEYATINLGSPNTVGIAPSGNGVAISYDGIATRWRPLNHTTNTIGSAIDVVRPGGQHAGLVSDSNGVDWIILATPDITYPSGIAGKRGVLKIRCDNPSINGILWNDPALDGWSCDSYFTNSAAKGEGRDWLAILTMQESSRAEYISATPWNGWQVAEGEIYMINMLTGDVRRLAHHRSRIDNSDSEYVWKPKLSMAPDGSRIVFTSNMGRCYNPVSSTNKLTAYMDLYTVTTGLFTGSDTAPPAAPTGVTIR